MEKWKKVKKSWLVAALTGVLIIGAGIVILVNASGLHSVFEPKEFESFENQYENGENYDSATENGEDSDLADENQDGEDRAEKETQKALKVAENDSRDWEDSQGLGMADEESYGDDSAQEPNPNAFEITGAPKPGGVDVRPNGKANENPSGVDVRPGSGGGGGNPANPGVSSTPGTPDPTLPLVPTNAPDPTYIPRPTDVPQVTDEPKPTGQLTSTPAPTRTPTPIPTQKPSSWEEEQLKPREPVETEDGVLVKLSASIDRTYYLGDVFQGEDASVVATFRQSNGTRKEKAVSYGGKDGYSVKISTKVVGIYTATFTYLGVTARAQYEVISSGVSVYYHGTNGEGIYAINFPGPLGGDDETMDKLSNRNFYPTSGGVVDLSDVHGRMVAYLGDEQIQKSFLKDISYKNVVFLEEEDGYLTTMLSGFQYFSNGNLEANGPYMYYPVYNWGTRNLRNVINVAKAVPQGYKIRRTVHDEENLEKYGADQILEQYTGSETVLSVPMGVTAISLKGKQGNKTITSLLLPESVSRIDFASVSECLPELEAYGVSGYSIYQVTDGVLYSRDKKTLVSVPAGKKNIQIPDMVTTIAKGAFCGSSIRELEIPDTVTVLEPGCFEDFHGEVIRMKGKQVPGISSDTGYGGKVLFEDSVYDVLLKKGMFAFKSQNIVFGAMDENGAEIMKKTGIYQYDSERNILTLKDEAETLAGIQADSYGRCIVPDGITAVAEGAFAQMVGLWEIQMPASMTEFREGSLVLPDTVQALYLSAAMTEVSPGLFGSLADGAAVPSIVIYVPKDYYSAYLEQWSQSLDTVYGWGTAARLLKIDDGTIFYEEGARYQKITDNETECYRLLMVYAQDETAFQVKEGTAQIQAGAFALCESLEILYLPDTLNLVEDGAFTGCKKLQTVTVKDAKILSGSVFAPLSSSVNVYEKGVAFVEFIYDNGIVYGKSADGRYTLLDVPTDYATNVVLYENTSSLNTEAFKDCGLLVSIDIPDQQALTKIGDRCFENCTALKSIRLDDAVRLETIGEEAFRLCGSLELLYLPDNLTETGKGLCYDCTSLQIVRAEGLQKIPEEMFYNCQSLLENGLSLGWEKIISIGNRAFAYCSLLTAVSDMPKLESIGDQAFFTCQRLSGMVLPETLSGMGEECFGECSSMTQVEMNGKLTGISRYCFYGCRELVKVDFSEQQKNTLQVVGVQAFGQCDSLESLDLSQFPALKQMGERTFAGCDLLSLVKLPKNLSKIPDYCFESCQNLSILALFSNEVTMLGEMVFGDTLSPFIHIWVREENLSDYRDAYQIILDQTYGEGTVANIMGIIDEQKEIIRGITFELTQEGRILKEASEAFEGDYTVPINTVRIEAEAFMNCTKLTGIELPDDSSISFGDRCFKGCTALERAELYGDIPQWGEEVFMDCTSLRIVSLGGGHAETIPRVGTRAFKGCTGLVGRESVTFWAAITTLGSECFADCTNLEAIPLSDSSRLALEVVEERAFAGCTSLTQFLTSAFTGVKSVGAYAFTDCDSLANPSVPANVTQIGEGVYAECDNLATVSFYCVLDEYPKNCFKNCPKLTRTGAVAAALSGLKRIGESTYEGCTSLTTNASWNLGRYPALEEIGANAFKGCTNMSDINLSATVKKVDSGAFDECIGVAQMTLNAPCPPQIGGISLDTLSENFCIKVPDSQSDGDSIYKAYLTVFTELFGNQRAYELLDSISDGAKERNAMPVLEENGQTDRSQIESGQPQAPEINKKEISGNAAEKEEGKEQSRGDAAKEDFTKGAEVKGDSFEEKAVSGNGMEEESE